MGDKPLAQSEVDPGESEEELGGLLDTAGVALSELSQLIPRAPARLRQLLQVAQSQL